MRRRRNRQVEEEYRRNAAVSQFIGGGKPPTTDTRLDPAVMAQRRMSDGSIADNQDYSRRILKVRLSLAEWIQHTDRSRLPTHDLLSGRVPMSFSLLLSSRRSRSLLHGSIWSALVSLVFLVSGVV